MKTFKIFILTALLVSLFSCSTNYTPALDDGPRFDGDTRGEASENDSTDNAGITATKGGWIVVSDTIVADEIPKDEAENDSIVSDTIPSDTIPKNKANINMIIFI